MYLVFICLHQTNGIFCFKSYFCFYIDLVEKEKREILRNFIFIRKFLVYFVLMTEFYDWSSPQYLNGKYFYPACCAVLLSAFPPPLSMSICNCHYWKRKKKITLATSNQHSCPSYLQRLHISEDMIFKGVPLSTREHYFFAEQFFPWISGKISFVFETFHGPRNQTPLQYFP